MTYQGLHLSRALVCLRAGYEGNAISWMIRDIGECSDQNDYPQPGTLIDCGDRIEYQSVREANENCSGAGI